MLTPAEADAAIAAHTAQFPEELLKLPACAGRILRQDVHAERDAPPFDRVAMDGIAMAFAAFRSGRRAYRVAAMQAKKNNAAVDEVQAIADRFNEQLRIFKARDKKD